MHTNTHTYTHTHTHVQPSEMYRNGSTYMCSDDVGPHYDPTNNIDNENYATDCNPDAPWLCEIGDLTGKHARITVAGEEICVDHYIVRVALYW